MPYPRVHPATEEEMSEAASIQEMKKNRWKGHYTICRKLRDMYHSVDSPDLKMECRIMVTMAKKMHEKLKENKDKLEKAGIA